MAARRLFPESIRLQNVAALGTYNRNHNFWPRFDQQRYCLLSRRATKILWTYPLVYDGRSRRFEQLQVHHNLFILKIIFGDWFFYVGRVVCME